MTPAEAHRPVPIVLVLLGALALSACGAVEGDRHRFQTMADHVASIDIPMDPQAASGGDRPQRRMSAEAQGLRPAKFSPMQVALMTPHEMWDARDIQSGKAPPATPAPEGGLRDAVVRMAEPAVEAAAPLMARAVVEQAAARVAPAEPRLRPAVARTASPAPNGRTIQLGAYSSEAGARQAWSRLKANAGLSNLSPVFEGVEVNGRSLTRLKVGPIPAEAAAALCQAAQVADPWCRRQG